MVALAKEKKRDRSTDGYAAWEAKLLGKAATLPERIGAYRGGMLKPGKDLSKWRFDGWKEYAAKGRDDLFALRLESLGITEDEARAVVSSKGVAVSERPEWAELLGSIIRRFEAGAPKQLINKRKGGLPFAAFFAPIVMVAIRELETRVEGKMAHLDKAVLDALPVYLVEYLDFATTALYQLFNDYRASGKKKAKKKSTKRYDAFVGQFFKVGGARRFFLKYAVFTRLLLTRINFWIAVMSEFIERFDAERAEIISAIFAGEEIGKLTRIDMGRGDSHNRGRTVFRLQFDGGKQLIYKPHDMQLDAEFANLQRRLNQDCGWDVFYEIRCLAKGDHGWAEFIEHQPCRNKQEVGQFYQRIGNWIALSYAMHGVDIHHENLIAHGAYPVLVDLETLFQPLGGQAGHASDESAEYSRAQQEQTYSVTKIGLLPSWTKLPNGGVVDMSSLSPSDSAMQKKLVWRNVNTDAMVRAWEAGKELMNQHVPYRKKAGTIIDPAKYLGELSTGFHAMYTHLMRSKNAYFTKKKLSESFTRKPVRYLLRATNLYMSILTHALELENLQDGRDFSIAIELLARPYTAGLFNCDGIFRLLDDEVASMQNLDVPRLSFAIEKKSIELEGGGRVEGFLRWPTIDVVSQKSRSLNEADCKIQEKLIHASFAMRNIRIQQKSWDDVVAVKPPKRGAGAPKRGYWISEAAKIADVIADDALTDKDGSIHWLSTQIDPETEAPFASFIGMDLYNGKIGIALALSALYHATGEVRYRELVHLILAQCKRGVELDKPRAASYSLGAFSGFGSVAYALVLISRFLGETEWQALAVKMMDYLSPELIGRDDAYDILGGSAGTIMTLLALYKETGNSALLEMAGLCADHLVERRKKDETGYRVWCMGAFKSRALCGFSHGASGIAHALYQLCIANPKARTEWWDAAVEALSYERAVFSKKASNWPDYRVFAASDKRKKPGFMVSWCHGAPGIGLMRAYAPDLISKKRRQKDIKAAICCTQGFGLNGSDHLCCGNFGRLGILADIAKKEALPKLRHDVLQSAKACCKRAGKQHCYLFPLEVPGVVRNHSFMHGNAGVLYQLLRFADSDAYPSVLAVES